MPSTSPPSPKHPASENPPSSTSRSPAKTTLHPPTRLHRGRKLSLGLALAGRLEPQLHCSRRKEGGGAFCWRRRRGVGGGEERKLR